MNNLRIMSGLLGLALTAVTAQAAAPSLSYEISGNELIITYTGALYQSVDAMNWTAITAASSPYKVALSDKKLFFCAKGDDTHDKDIIVPLSDDVNLDMIWIEPGTFLMGSPEDELGRYDNEVQHEVTLTRGYWLGKYEVTQAQYEAVTGKDPSYNKGSDLPVEQVNWAEAKEFCAKLTAIEKAAGRLPEGYEYTLPTEAQWEYACRAGTTTALNNGKNLSDAKQCPEMDEVGWYWYNSEINGRRVTHPVGQKLPNAWGLYDMHGNVNEWCLDWYGDYPTSAVTDPMGAVTGWSRVIRSGSWNNNANNCSSAFRSYTAPDNRSGGIGFRVALVSKDMNIPLSDDVNLDMIWVEPGTFLMGSPEDELGRYSFEIQHEVTLSYGYWLSKYEVTQEQYKAVMGYNHSTRVGVNHPVESVTWEMAMKFCARLTAIEREAGRLPQGYVYSLPTEAQWEYACRAGTTTALNSGKNLSDKDKCPEMDEVGWYKYNSGEYDADGKHTNEGNHYPVGQKLPNAWGFYDMHGNVAEWCLDKSAKDYPNTAVTDPLSFVGTTSYVVRGGKWTDSSARECRSASRHGIGDNYCQKDVGFRVALIKDMLIPLYPLASYVNLDMIWIEPGSFIMGSPTDELGRDDDELQHEVTLTQGYWMGRYEITQAQYKAVMETNPSYFKDYEVASSLPVEQVSWDDAMEFCAKLTAIEREAGRLPKGYEYTLPTEAQWEYACRAGTTTALNSGKNLTDVEVCPNVDELGWYANNSDDKTHPVGQKQPNAWGLYDMHGNVWEWCLDKKGDYPTTPVIDPVELVTGMDRARHGGCWQNNAAVCRSANRGYRSNSDKDTGFRVVLTPVK